MRLRDGAKTHTECCAGEPPSYGLRVRSDKVLRNAFRRLQLPISDDPTNVFAAIVPAVPAEIGHAWEELHNVDEDRIAFAFSTPAMPICSLPG